ncbi:MAG: STAS domain-containing protein [Streptosporangiaceae bacterium]|nr:STAS domain-containing protein [Streptosporangiaceae bacterium]
MTTLTTAVTAGESGPVLVLSGEADITTTAELSQLLTAHLAEGTTDLTIDISGLRFADSAAIHTLLRAARTLNDRGGTLTLLHPQQAVAKVLTILGVDQLITLRDMPHAQPSPGSASGPS